MGRSRMSSPYRPHIILHKLQKLPLTPPFGAAMLMAQNRKENIFFGGKTTHMQEKKVEEIIVHDLKCK